MTKHQDERTPAQRAVDLCDDLEAEHLALDAIVREIDEASWSTPTPAEGWAVRDQISHLTYFDHAARLAIEEPDAFARQTEELLARHHAGRGAGDTDLGRSCTGAELLDRWRQGRHSLHSAVRGADAAQRVPWYAQPMSLTSFVTARLMESWAHGQDIVDALGAEPVVSQRLRHVCHIGVSARPYAFFVQERPDPGDPIRIEVAAPSGELWTWGPETAANRVSGEALDLALLVTQRRHLHDTALEVVGPTAAAWASIAQAFAGSPGRGRAHGLGRVVAPKRPS